MGPLFCPFQPNIDVGFQRKHMQTTRAPGPITPPIPAARTCQGWPHGCPGSLVRYPFRGTFTRPIMVKKFLKLFQANVLPHRLLAWPSSSSFLTDNLGFGPQLQSQPFSSQYHPSNQQPSDWCQYTWTTPNNYDCFLFVLPTASCLCQALFLWAKIADLEIPVNVLGRHFIESPAMPSGRSTMLSVVPAESWENNVH